MKNAFEYEAELAALQEELARSRKGNGALVDRLDDAEQRISSLCGLLVRTLPVVRMVGRQDHLCDYAMAGDIRAEIEITLNPKESGASE